MDAGELFKPLTLQRLVYSACVEPTSRKIRAMVTESVVSARHVKRYSLHWQHLVQPRRSLDSKGTLSGGLGSKP